MTDDWEPVLVLPNILLTEAINSEFVSMAPTDDCRVIAIKEAQPAFQRFLGSFSDNFGIAFEPTVLLRHAEAPIAFNDITALASFRDLVAIATITRARALELLHPRGHRITFGDAFAIYPWMIDREYEKMVGSTPAILGLYDGDRFKGQSSPSLFRTPLNHSEVDAPLLCALVKRWTRYFNATSPDWADTALLRSLNMAYHASLMPAGTETNLYDAGRIIALWVSAFEILVHPGGRKKANCRLGLKPNQPIEIF